MKIGEVLNLLNEYNTSGTNATLAMQGGKKATGKNYDNIVAGVASPNKTKEYIPKYANLYPTLWALVKKVKGDALGGDIIVTGKALAEWEQLTKTYKPKQTPEGDFSLPFGDKVRIKVRNNITYIGLNDDKALHSEAPQVMGMPQAEQPAEVQQKEQQV